VTGSIKDQGAVGQKNQEKKIKKGRLTNNKTKNKKRKKGNTKGFHSGKSRQRRQPRTGGRNVRKPERGISETGGEKKTANPSWFYERIKGLWGGSNTGVVACLPRAQKALYEGAKRENDSEGTKKKGGGGGRRERSW